MTVQQPVEERFIINGAVDILWVVDSSGSMESSQDKIAAGFESFAKVYLTPEQDIRLAVITTDVFLAGDPSIQMNNADNPHYPFVGQNYSRLLPGIHDGLRPIARDATSFGTRSGRPILHTRPPAGVAGDKAFTEKLASDFILNAKPGTKGSGDERGMQSVVQFLKDNENRPECKADPVVDPTCFFRKGSIRVLIFVSDEMDSSRFPGITTVGGQIDYAKNFFDAFFTGLDGPDTEGKLNANYFVIAIVNQTLAGSKCDPTVCAGDLKLNPFVYNSTPQRGLACTYIENVNPNKNYGFSDCKWSREYLSLVDRYKDPAAVTNNKIAGYSLVRSIGESNYDSILNALGQAVKDTSQTVNVVTTIKEVTYFDLGRVPSDGFSFRLYIVHANGSRVEIPKSQYKLVESHLQIIRPGFPAELQLTDELEVVYTPTTSLDQ